jgi:hypothetical protein
VVLLLGVLLLVVLLLGVLLLVVLPVDCFHSPMRGSWY